MVLRLSGARNDGHAVSASITRVLTGDTMVSTVSDYLEEHLLRTPRGSESPWSSSGSRTKDDQGSATGAGRPAAHPRRDGPFHGASMGGLEPPTPAFGGQCSIQLSYMDRSPARWGGWSCSRSRSRSLVGDPGLVEESLGVVEFGRQDRPFLAFPFQGGFEEHQLLEGHGPPAFQT